MRDVLLISCCSVYLMIGPIFSAERAERDVPERHVRIVNRIREDVQITLLPRRILYVLKSSEVQDFRCDIVQGIILRQSGTGFQVHCKRRYAVKKTEKGLEIVELIASSD